MYKLDLKEEPEIKLPTSVGSSEKRENSRKASTSASLTMLKPLTVWITTSYITFFKRWEYQTTLPASLETCMQEKEMATHSNILAWEIPEESDGLQRVRHGLVTKQQQQSFAGLFSFTCLMFTSLDNT